MAKPLRARVPHVGAFALGAIIGASLFPLLNDESIILVTALLMVAAILLGWLATFQARAVELSHASFLFAFLRVVPDKWVAPLQASPSILALCILVGVLAGGLLRLLLLSHA